MKNFNIFFIEVLFLIFIKFDSLANDNKNLKFFKLLKIKQIIGDNEIPLSKEFSEEEEKIEAPVLKLESNKSKENNFYTFSNNNEKNNENNLFKYFSSDEESNNKKEEKK